MNTILTMIQGLILDLTLTEEQLERFACLSSIFVMKDIEWEQTYTISFNNLTITPDPTDINFCLFVATYAVILIIQSEIRTAAMSSMKVTDGPSTLDLTSKSKALLDYLKTLKDDYEKAKIDYVLNGSVNTGGYAIITPTTNLNIYPGNYN